MVNRIKTDWFMFAIAAALALFGALMVYSASAMIAVRESGGASAIKLPGAKKSTWDSGKSFKRRGKKE